MEQSKFDRELAAALDSLTAGVGRFLAGRDLDGTRRTDVDGDPRKRTGRLRSSDGSAFNDEQMSGWGCWWVRLVMGPQAGVYVDVVAPIRL